MHYTLNFTYSFRNISADVHLYLKEHRKWHINWMTRSVDKDCKVQQGAPSFSRVECQREANIPLSKPWAQWGSCTPYSRVCGFLCPQAVCMDPQSSRQAWQVGQTQTTLEDDAAIIQCVCDGKKAWHCAKETVNLLGRPNFLFK